MKSVGYSIPPDVEPHGASTTVTWPYGYGADHAP